jgi:hypothetical protein
MPEIIPGVGAVARFTRTNSCCAPVPGECNAAVTKKITSMEFSAQTNEETREPVLNMDGSTCLPGRTINSLTGYEVTLNRCVLDLEQWNIFTGQDLMLGWDGLPIGGYVREGQLNLSGWALELWITEESGDACDPLGQGRYFYNLFPCLTAAVEGDFTVENGTSIAFTYTATTRPGNAWCRGPWNVIEQSEGDLVGGQLLEPIPEGTHKAFAITSIPPPVPAVGCITVPAIDLGCSSPGDSPGSP